MSLCMRSHGSDMSVWVLHMLGRVVVWHSFSFLGTRMFRRLKLRDCCIRHEWLYLGLFRIRILTPWSANVRERRVDSSCSHFSQSSMLMRARASSYQLFQGIAWECKQRTDLSKHVLLDGRYSCRCVFMSLYFLPKPATIAYPSISNKVNIIIKVPSILTPKFANTKKAPSSLLRSLSLIRPELSNPEEYFCCSACIIGADGSPWKSSGLPMVA